MVLVCVVSALYLVEGPNYLYRKHKIEQCRRSLRFIARINGTTEEYHAIEKEFKYETVAEEKEKES